MIQAVLFDMDGLLIDSERIYAQGVLAVAGGLGCAISEEMLQEALGTTDAVTDAIFARDNPGYDGPALRRALGDWLRQGGYDRRMPGKPYAGELLRRLTGRGVPCGLVTSSSRATAENYLRQAGMFDLFSVVVTGDLGLPSKPAPDVYLHAAQQLGIPIGACAVLEDSPNGLRAGRAAGAVTVMVPDLVPYTEALAPVCDHVVQNLMEAEAILCR